MNCKMKVETLKIDHIRSILINLMMTYWVELRVLCHMPMRSRIRICYSLIIEFKINWIFPATLKDKMDKVEVTKAHVIQNKAKSLCLFKKKMKKRNKKNQKKSNQQHPMTIPIAISRCFVRVQNFFSLDLHLKYRKIRSNIKVT